MRQIESSELDAEFELFYGGTKKKLWKSGRLYYPNGKIAWDGLKFLTPSEKIVYVNKHLFHLNGQIAWNPNTKTGYDTDGSFLSNFGVGVKIIQGMTILCNNNWFGVHLSCLINSQEMSDVQIFLHRFE